MTARILDGKATAGRHQGRADRAGRTLAERGVVPGLGTVLVGDDPGSRWYVNGKHKDCAEVGIASIRGELPATATQAEVEAVDRRAQRRPGLHRLHRPAAAAHGLDENGVLGQSTRPRTRTACTRRTSAGWCSASPARCRARRTASSNCCAATTSRSPAPTSSWSAAGSTVGRPLGLLLTRKQRERDGDAVPHRHPGPRRPRRRADIVVAAAGVPGMITAEMVKPGAAVLDVGVSRVDGKLAGDVAHDVCGGRRLGAPNPGGVGPMTRAMLLANIVDAAESAAG